MTIRLIALVLVSMLAIGCGATSAEWKTVDDVVSALDKHTLSDKQGKFFQMLHADDGASYDVNPGGYRLEFYVYENKDDIPKGIAALQSIMDDWGGLQGEVVEKNILLIARARNSSGFLEGSIDETLLERLLADLRD